MDEISPCDQLGTNNLTDRLLVITYQNRRTALVLESSVKAQRLDHKGVRAQTVSRSLLLSLKHFKRPTVLTRMGAVPYGADIPRQVR